MDKIIEAITKIITPENTCFVLLLLAMCIITYLLAPIVKNKENITPAKQDKKEEENKQDLIHDHTKCPNYTTCQELKEEIANKVNKEEFKGLSDNFNNLSGQINVLNVLVAGNSADLKNVSKGIDFLTNYILESKR